MWFACFVILVAILIWQAWKEGPNQAIGRVMVLSLLVPTWIVIKVWGFPLDIRIASGIAALGTYCLHPKAVFRTRLVLVDWVAIALVAVHLASDWSLDGFSWRVPVRAYGEWVVPYLAGRLAIQSWDDVRKLTPIVLGVCLVLATCAAIEAIARVNLFELGFGVRPVDGPARELSRWGLKRAFGPLKNPIYLGALLVLLFPWAIYGAVLAVRRRGPRWWLVQPAVVALGILFSVSRAPLLAMLPLLLVTVAAVEKRWRKPLIGVAILGAVLLFLNRHALLQSDISVSENRREKITVGEQQVEYTSTLHRLYLFDVYWMAMKRAGWLGFGTEMTTGFPPRVPVGPQQLETLKRLWCVDNAYILMVLRFGYLGLLTFLFLELAALGTFASLTRGQGLRRGVFAGSMAGAVLATMLVLFTVWLPHDFGFWFMWTVGTSAGLRSKPANLLPPQDHGEAAPDESSNHTWLVARSRP